MLQICVSFYDLRTTPEYYEVVSNPIDMLKIQQRMKTEEYDAVDDMVADVELMINNAQAYYEVGEIHSLLSKRRRNVMGGGGGVKMVRFAKFAYLQKFIVAQVFFVNIL